MGKRKVTILEPAVEELARVAMYIEEEGLPKTAKRFVDDAFAFFKSLADEKMCWPSNSITVTPPANSLPGWPMLP
jgi:hypothetical protein